MRPDSDPVGGRSGFRAWIEWADPSHDRQSWLWTLLLIVAFALCAIAAVFWA